MSNIREDMNIVIAGHVDHGKSTIIGRLLSDTNSLPEGKLEQVKENCRRNSKPFEYAFLLDALKDEQAQGITIDAARCFFKTDKGNYIIIDAPGHIEFLKNMVTGAARAEAALLVIDAGEGIKENSKRHGYLLSMLGINQVTVLVNKMDLTGYDENVFNNIVSEFTAFLEKINIKPHSFIPISGFFGENITKKSDKMEWYKGKTILETLDLFENKSGADKKYFRMPVQAVYKFTGNGDSRRIVSGTIETGTISAGDEVVFYPSGKRTKVKSIESFNTEIKSSVSAGTATGFTIEEQIYIKRGETAVKGDEHRPDVTTRIRANIFWLGRAPFEKNKEYLLKTGTSKVKVRIEEIKRVVNASTLEAVKKDKIERNETAECILKTENPIAFDTADKIFETSRFVIIDNYEISGGGVIQEALEDSQSAVREKVLARNYKWEQSFITSEDRAVRYSQKSALILITGKKGTGRRDIAKTLEKKLFDGGRVVYYLGMGNVIHGLDADLDAHEKKEEHLRRMAEVSNILLEAGTILIVTAVELSKNDLDIVKTIVNQDKIETVWIGEELNEDAKYDYHIKSFDTIEEASLKIKSRLADKGIIFRV